MDFDFLYCRAFCLDKLKLSWEKTFFLKYRYCFDILGNYPTFYPLWYESYFKLPSANYIFSFAFGCSCKYHQISHRRCQ